MVVKFNLADPFAMQQHDDLEDEAPANVEFNLAEPLGMGLNEEAEVERIAAGGQAERAGLAPGSRIRTVDGSEIDSLAELKARLAELKKGRGETAVMVMLGVAAPPWHVPGKRAAAQLARDREAWRHKTEKHKTELEEPHVVVRGQVVKRDAASGAEQADRGVAAADTAVRGRVVDVVVERKADAASEAERTVQ